MNLEAFNIIIEQQVRLCENVLITKGEEYAPIDRLHNFRQAANLEGVTLAQALAGMMAKHTVSVYDMCWDAHNHPIEVWTEKITDHINYLLLLKAVLVEDMAEDIDLTTEGTNMGSYWSKAADNMDSYWSKVADNLEKDGRRA